MSQVVQSPDYVLYRWPLRRVQRPTVPHQIPDFVVHYGLWSVGCPTIHDLCDRHELRIFVVWVLPCQDFIHDHPQRPDIRVSGARSGVKGLWGHPPHGFYLPWSFIPFDLGGYFGVVHNVKDSLGDISGNFCSVSQVTNTFESLKFCSSGFKFLSMAMDVCESPP